MNYIRNAELKSLNTFRIEGKADALVLLHNEEDIQKFIIQEIPSWNRTLVLGQGSNILFSDDFHGLILKSEIKEISVIKEDQEHIFVKTGSGLPWDDLVQWAVTNNLWGIENLSGIPGKVGAAPVQNIGAYGVEQSKTFVSLEAFNLSTGDKRVFSSEACSFSYRNSVFKHKEKDQWLISNVTFRLSKKGVHHLEYGNLKKQLSDIEPKDLTPSLLSEQINLIRSGKLPDYHTTGNAGSFFKNPVIPKEMFERMKKDFPDIVSFDIDEKLVKLAAGWLIESCGWKGYRKGDAGVYEKQALVLVNHGNASGREIVSLAQTITESVFRKFGVQLEPEVIIL